jgi:ketosteroid isomerase-like protein
MTSAENKQLVRDFFDAGNRGEMERCLSYLADDIVWTNMGTTRVSGTFVGKSSLVTNVLQPVFGQLKSGIASTIENLVAEGEFVVVQSRGKAETIDGRPYDNSYCHIFRIVGGQIATVTEYLDTQLAAAIFGASR